MERFQPKMLPDLVIGWQAEISPTLNPAGHVVSTGVLQGPIPVICGGTCLMCPVALCTSTEKELKHVVGC